MSIRKKMAGMSLIETILYLGIAVFVLSALFSYGWNVISIGVKSQVIQETVVAGQLIGERLRFEIRQAESVDRTLSNFPSKIVLQKDGETVVIEMVNDQISLKRGAADPVRLHSSDIRIANFAFTEQAIAVDGTDKTDYVGFSFDAVADYPGSETRSEWQYSLPFVSGAALRTAQ